MLPWATLSLDLELEPVDAAVAHADAVDAERLGDDDVVGAASVDAARLGEPGDAREAAALLVDAAAHLDAALELDAGALQALHGVDGGGNPRLHVAGAAAVETSVAHFAPEGIDGPSLSRGNDVGMPVQVHERPR